MADPLRWDKIDFQFGSGGGSPNIGNLLQESMAPLIKSMEADQIRREESRSMREVQKGLGITDPDLFNQAVRDGVIKIDKYNIDIIRNRAHDLLTDNLNKLTTAATLKESAAALETRKITNRGAELTNTNTGLMIEDNRLKVQKNLHDWNNQLEMEKIRPEAMKQMAQLQTMATGGVGPDGKPIAANPAGALRIARSPGFVEMAIKGGFTQEQLAGLEQSFYTSSENARVEDKRVHDYAIETGARPVVDETNRIAREEALATAKSGQGTNAAQRADAALKATLSKEKTDIDQYVHDNMDEIISHVGSATTMDQRIDKIPNITEAKREALRIAVKSAMASVSPLTPEEYSNQLREQNPDAPYGPHTRTDPATASSGIVSLVDSTEAKGDYRAMYAGAQNDPNSGFSNVDVTKATISQLNAIANGGYGDWVAQRNNGVYSTPFGRYQIVNQTLQEAAAALGMDPDTTVFDQATQDRIFKYLLEKRVGGGGDPQSKLEAIRNEWAGLRNVDDATLLGAINDYRRGEFTKEMGGPGGQGSQGREIFDQNVAAALQGAGQTFVIDQTYGEEASKFLSEKVKQTAPIDAQDWDILTGLVTQKDSEAVSMGGKLMADNMFGGNVAGLMDAIQDPDNQKLVSGQVAATLAQQFPDMDIGQVTDDLKSLESSTGLKPGILGAFLLASPAESWWVMEKIGADNVRHLNVTEVENTIKQFYDSGAKTSDQKVAGFMANLEQIRAKTTASSELAQAQTRVRQAMADLTQASSRVAANPDIDIKPEKVRLEVAIKAQDALLRRLEKSGILNANLTGQQNLQQ